MKQLVVLSGKGGAGKTSLTASFADLSAAGPTKASMVIADADVDASNLALVLNPHPVQRTDFWGGQIAQVDRETCLGCGACQAVCRFDAIQIRDGISRIDPIACEGCAACMYTCPQDAITMHMQVVGQWYHSETRYGPLIHAHLKPAQENSGKLVSQVKKQAQDLAEEHLPAWVLVDGPPGIGCPVISALSGADLALVVVEPGLSGVHDMRRALETIHHFDIPAAVCINKSDLYPEGCAEIKRYCHAHDLDLLGTIPFDETITEAMTHGKPVTSYRPLSPASQAIKKIWSRVMDHLFQPLENG